MSDSKKYLDTYRCNVCEYGPCVASCERRPTGCLDERRARFDPEWIGPTWRRVRNVADDLDELFVWEDGAETIHGKEEGASAQILDRNYPEWFHYLTCGHCYDSGLVWALRSEFAHCDGLLTPYDDEEREKTLKRYKKEEIAQAFAGYGFACGLLYGEWRRKDKKEVDWEIVDDGEDCD